MKSKFYNNFLNANYNGENIEKLFYKDLDNFFKAILTFYSPENVKFNFSVLDNLLSFDIFKKQSIKIYSDLHKELRKRKVFLLEKDFNTLFCENITLLYEYINTSIIIKNKKKKSFYVDYTENNFLLKNTHKPLFVSENTKKFKINNFEKYSPCEKFEKIFDSILGFNSYSYISFMKDKRKNIKLQSFDNFFREKDITNHSYQTLKSNINFFIKGKKDIEFIDIYVADILKDDFFYLLNIIRIIFKGKKYRIRIKKTFDEFKKITNNKKINIFLCYENTNIYPLWWTNQNRYILSIKDIKNDLFLLFLKDLDKKLLKLKTTKNLTKKELEHFYNTNYYVSRRVDAFINFLEEGGNGFNCEL